MYRVLQCVTRTALLRFHTPRRPLQVQFTERAESFDSHASVAAMEQSIHTAVALVQKLYDMNSQLSFDSNYLSRMARERQTRWEDDAMVTK